MKIAYISFEFPPDTAIGGIASYLESTARLMAKRGHKVEVFTSSPFKESLNEIFAENILIHRIHTSDRDDFYKLIVPEFSHRHSKVNFDLVESPEYRYEGLGVREAFPELPMVVRFHTPSFWVKKLNSRSAPVPFKEKIKKTLGIKQYKKEKDKEYRFAMMADTRVAACNSMKDILAENWCMDRKKIEVIPNPFLAAPELLKIPVVTNTQTVTYFGRLEIRKGVTALADAIPLVLQEMPRTRFRFVGKPNLAPGKKILMDKYLQRQLKPFEKNIIFTDHVPREKVIELLGQTDICVFPSYWELFGYVCAEAMAAARGIVASMEGGMKDMLEDINGGILIDPYSPRQIADGILYLLRHPGERFAMAERSREKITDYYQQEVASRIETSYLNTIRKKRVFPVLPAAAVYTSPAV